jgi:hypothetical protein
MVSFVQRTVLYRKMGMQQDSFLFGKQFYDEAMGGFSMTKSKGE